MILSVLPLASSAPLWPWWTSPRAPLLLTTTPLAQLSLRPQTKDEVAYVLSVLVEFEGKCVGAFADGTGQHGDNNDNIESVESEVGYKDHIPH